MRLAHEIPSRDKNYGSVFHFSYKITHSAKFKTLSLCVEYINQNYEAKVVQEIAESIYKGLNHELPHISENLVGINYRVQEMMNLFGIGLDDVRFIGIWGMAGIVYLQNKLLFEIPKEKELYIWNSLEWSNEIKKRLHNRKVVIVIDDVDKDEQLQALAGSSDWFGPGSRIIITCRDKNLLERNHISIIYRAKGLYDSEALELFSWTVFKKPDLEEEFEDLSWEFVKYAKGHPLAITVLGEDENRVARIEGSGCYKNLESLKDKSLITILRRKLWMHDLLQEMGWRIVRGKSPQERGSYSRLWLYEDVFHVLKNNTGTELVESIVFNSPQHKENLNDKAFSGMKRLRLIKICNVHLPRGLDFVSNELRSMEWHDYPLQYMPMSFQPDNLVELIMPRGLIEQLPKGFSNLAKLRIMDLSNSQNLIMTPNFNGLSSLQKLIFRGCTTLLQLHPSVGALKKLELLDLKDCKRCKAQPPKSLLSQGLSLIRTIPVLGIDSFLPTLHPKQDPINLLLPRLSGFSSMASLDEMGSYISIAAFNPAKRSEIPEWFNHQSRGSFITVPLPSNLLDNISWRGIAFYIIFEEPKNPNDIPLGQNLNFFINIICDMDISLGLGASPVVLTIDKKVPFLGSSFEFFSFLRAGQLRDHLEDCSCISALIKSDRPDIEVKICGARIMYEEDLVDFTRIISGRSCTDLESFTEYQLQVVSGQSDSNIKLIKRKLESLLSRLYEGDRARNHKYDYIFPSIKIPTWFRHQSFCPDLRIKLPPNLQKDKKWIGIAVCASYNVKRQPVGSGDNQDLTSFLNFYNPLGSNRLCLTRHKVFQDSRDVFVGSSHRILVFYIPHMFLRLPGYIEIEASFEPTNPGVQVKECGIRLVFEQDIEEFVQTLVQCMLQSPEAYHSFYYQGLFNQVAETVADFEVDEKKFGYHSSLQRMPQTMPKLPPTSIENIVDGCNSSETISNQVIATGSSRNFSPSLTSVLEATWKGQPGITMSGESMFKENLQVFQKDFEENEIIDTCFAQCEIPQWFCEYEDCSTVNTQLNPNAFDNLNCMGIAVCALFSFHKHPTAVRMDKDSGISHDFHCLLRANSRPVHRVWKTINEDKISISLTPRKFIWVLFFPRATLLDYLSETGSSGVHFEFRTEGPDLLVQNWEFKPIVKANKDELMLTVVQCSTPPGSVLDCCDTKLVHEMWYNLLFKISVSLGLCYHYEGLYPQPQSLFISEGKTSGTAQYSYDQFRYFNPSTSYNSCFPTRRTLEWFNYQSRGHSVTIDISPNLYDDNNWIGLALYASFSIPKDYTAVMKYANLVKWSHCLYCQLQTSRAGQDDQIRVCQINDEETNWLFTLYGFTWISYMPGEAFKDMLHQCDHIKASFVSDWGGVTVQKCGVRLLYEHDQLQFERELQNCNALISGYRDFMHRNSSSFVRNQKIYYATKSLSNYHIQQTVNDFLDRCSVYSRCFPPVEILNRFSNKSNKPSVTINIPKSCEWMGLVVCAYFSVHDQTAFLDRPNSTIPHQLFCLLESNAVDPVRGKIDVRTNKEEFLWLDVEGRFLWLSYLPFGFFPDRAIQDSSSTSIEVSFVSDWPGVTVQKCGLCFYYEHDEWLQTIINNCWQEYLLQDHINLKMIGKSKFNPNHNDEAGPLRTSSGVEDEDHHEIPRKPNIAESSGPENQLSENDPQPKDQRSQNDLLMFDRCLVYNAWFPLSEILEWCNLQSDVTHVTIPVPPNLYSDCAWLGLALIASFEINVNEVAILDIQDSEASFNLICYLGSDIEGVKRFYTYDLTKDILELLHQGGLVWLCYIPRESFRDSLNQCSWIKALIQTNCPGLTVQKCGLHLSYDHDEAEQKEIKRCCKAFFPHRHEVRSSVPSSSNNNDAQPERQRQCFNDEAGPRRTSSSIEDLHQEIPRKPIYTGETSKSKQLGENDPHPKDQHYQSDLLDFDRCLVYSSCLPPCKILEWFRLQSEEPQLRIPLPPNLFDDSTWMGLALCISFEVNVNEAAALNIEDSETSYYLICHLEASIECVEPLHVYCLTGEHLKKLLQLGGFNWLFYISHGSFRDSLNQCTWIEAKIGIDYPDLTLQKCGLHLLYQHEEAEFKETIRYYTTLFHNEHEVRSSILSSSNNEESQPERQRGRVDPVLKGKGKQVLE
ncbi:hypothetical protein SO802_024741 [Lithocarpus litseifolius]|uniref:ADP-ribosyl cyclase/cyclic ADP-ribose hydrolase n=1 Tax=Lithocarpus litseifolius TaxID=425828 RepID=A0AAW2CBI5_9ROSI